MFKKLFSNIFSYQEESVKLVYNDGVTALARGDIRKAISLFEKVCNQHPSAAYNLGLIYLDGAGQFTPKYNLARKYFALADQLGHQKAVISAQVIGLTGERVLTIPEQLEFFQLAVTQYTLGRQLGNLAYLVAYDIKRNILETSRDEQYSLDRFISYELYCIRNYGNDEVMNLYRQSSLINLSINYQDDWENGETAVISDYLNNQVWGSIIACSGGKLNFDEMGPLRLAIVNTVFEYYM
ncbi:hypothetical protein [Actinobacillus porcinus]|uniref:hypothetical protein n=1 Tax=Actinobacillus porcinus TaxID=51048 RepID=UPI0023542A45|nr:hypothetical protein [Actinobacillus porcinus]MCI5764282.1 hypothetical protein [Actinobacillus porcinus]MDY6215440.1 hypothetical protein [Actinobacillus porcinus]